VRGDVIDIEIVVLRAPVFVRVVETTHRTFLDGTAGAAIFRTLMRLALVLRWSIRAEVAVASGCLRTAAGVHRTRTTETARTGSAEPSRSTGTWPAETAGPRSAEATAGPRAAWSALFTRARLADGERPSPERLLVEPLDRFFCDGAIRVIDEREASRSSGLPIHGEYNRCGLADAGQVRSQLCLRGDIRQIANEQTD
jgi:hypothetical protein